MDFFKSWHPFLIPGVLVVLIGGLWTVAFAEPISAGYAAVTIAVHDSKVKSDLAAISSALEAYYAKNHTYIIPGAGFAGEGEGWLAIKHGTSSDALYTASIIDKLRDGGFLKTQVSDDPSYAYPKDPTPRNYMLYVCNGGQTYALSATLQSPTVTDKSKQQSSCNASISSKFAKNYVVTNSHKVSTKPVSKAALPYCKLTFTASTSVLSWNVTKANTIVMRTTDAVLGNIASSSSMILPSNASTTYTIVATNAAGTTQCSLQISSQRTASSTTPLHVVKPRKPTTSPHATSTRSQPPTHATSTPPVVSATSTVAQMQKALAEMVIVADFIGRNALPQVSRYISGYVADIHTANAYAQSGLWSKVAPALQSATTQMLQANALLSHTSALSVPNTSYSALKNTALCGHFAVNTATQAQLYAVKYLLHQVVATSSLHVDSQLVQSSSAQAIRYLTCFNTYKQQISSSTPSATSVAAPATVKTAAPTPTRASTPSTGSTPSRTTGSGIDTRSSTTTTNRR